VVGILEQRRALLPEMVIKFHEEHLVAQQTEDATENASAYVVEYLAKGTEDGVDVDSLGLSVTADISSEFYWTKDRDRYVESYKQENASDLLNPGGLITWIRRGVGKVKYLPSTTHREFVSDATCTKEWDDSRGRQLDVYPRSVQRPPYFQIFDLDYSLYDWPITLTAPLERDQSIIVRETESGHVEVVLHRESKNWDVIYEFMPELGFALGKVRSVRDGELGSETIYSNFKEIVPTCFVPYAIIERKLRSKDKKVDITTRTVEEWQVRPVRESELMISPDKYDVVFDHVNGDAVDLRKKP